MTPAVNLIKKSNYNHQLHEYNHEANCQAYGLEAVEKLGVEQAQVYKTLVVMLDNKELAVAVIPVASKLNLKCAAKELKAKKAVMASRELVERTTGYVLGGISPIAQKKKLRTLIDITAKQQKTLYVSAGKRGLEIELTPFDLQTLTEASFVNLCQ